MQIVKDEMWDRLVELDLIWYEEWILWGTVCVCVSVINPWVVALLPWWRHLVPIVLASDLSGKVYRGS